MAARWGGCCSAARYWVMPDVRAAGHADLAGGPRLRPEVLDDVVAVARLPRREEVPLEVPAAPAGAAHVHHRADHPAGREEVGREASAESVAAVRGHPDDHRERPRQRVLAVLGRERDGRGELDAVVHRDQHLLRDALDTSAREARAEEPARVPPRRESRARRQEPPVRGEGPYEWKRPGRPKLTRTPAPTRARRSRATARRSPPRARAGRGGACARRPARRPPRPG